MPVWYVPAKIGNCASAFLRWNTTVCAFGVLIPDGSSSALSRAYADEPFALSRMWRKLHATSFDVSGLPLWNLTPGRSLNVHVFASAVACQATASRGLSAHVPGTMYVSRS